MKTIRVALLTLLVLPGPLAAEVSEVRMKDTMRLHAIELVNRERRAHGLHPVALDSYTSMLADEFSARQLRDRVAGHYSLDGVAPYMRYPWRGSRDMLRENVGSWSANYAFEPTALPDLVGRSHRTMMDERPPNDGHRRAILDPHATHMGFGVAWSGGELRFTQLFVRRWIDWLQPVPATLTTGETTELVGRPHPGYELTGVSVHWEPHPRPMQRRAIEQRDDYALPSNRIDLRPAPPTSATGLASRAKQLNSVNPVSTLKDGSFRVRLPIDRGTGVYTAIVWLQPIAGGDPFAAGLSSIAVTAPTPGRAGAAR